MNRPAPAREMSPALGHAAVPGTKAGTTGRTFFLRGSKGTVGVATAALLLIFCLGIGDEAQADDILPKPFPASRYEKMSARSPFSPPTVAAFVPAAPTVPTVSWSDKLAVTALMEQGGKYFATVVDRDSSQHFLISSDTENNDHDRIMLSSVQWAAKINQTRITIRKGTEFGQVAFDPSAAVSTSSPAVPGAIPGAFPRLGAGPTLPGARPFNPPPGANGGPRPTQPAPAVIRRGPISAAPVTPNAGRSALNRATPQTPADDDDDDDQ